MLSQKDVVQKGASMRLGEYSCEVSKKSKAYKSYKETSINERHRHRYEFNNKYLDKIDDTGLAYGIKYRT